MHGSCNVFENLVPTLLLILYIYSWKPFDHQVGYRERVKFERRVASSRVVYLEPLITHNQKTVYNDTGFSVH